MKNALVAFKLLIFLTILTGIAYPVAVTVIGQAAFPGEAQGSLIRKEGVVIGSSLIAQKFSQGRYFWVRPSAIDFNPLPSGGSNLAPTSKKLADFAKEQRAKYPGLEQVPNDLVFASASGLDPHLSPEAIQVQVTRVLNARGWTDEKRLQLEALIKGHTMEKQLVVFGERRVNVLELNMALDALK